MNAASLHVAKNIYNDTQKYKNLNSHRNMIIRYYYGKYPTSFKFFCNSKLQLKTATAKLQLKTATVASLKAEAMPLAIWKLSVHSHQLQQLSISIKILVHLHSGECLLLFDKIPKLSFWVSVDIALPKITCVGIKENDCGLLHLARCNSHK